MIMQSTGIGIHPNPVLRDVSSPGQGSCALEGLSDVFPCKGHLEQQHIPKVKVKKYRCPGCCRVRREYEPQSFTRT